MHINKQIYNDLSWEGRVALLILFLLMVNGSLVISFLIMENIDITAEQEKLLGPIFLIIFSLFLNHKLQLHCCKKDNYSWKHAVINFAYNFITILGLICLAFWDGKINYYIISYAVILSYFFVNSAFEFGKNEFAENFGK